MNTEKLILNLEELTRQYRLLLDLVRKEKQILIDANIDLINESNLQKEILLNKIYEQDQLRVQSALEVAQKLNMPSDEARLLNIARQIGGVHGDKLRSQHAALEMILKRLADLNQENAAYADAALRNVAGALNSIKETLMGPQTYTKGKYQKSNKPTSLVSKEA